MAAPLWCNAPRLVVTPLSQSQFSDTARQERASCLRWAHPGRLFSDVTALSTLSRHGSRGRDRGTAPIRAQAATTASPPQAERDVAAVRHTDGVSESVGRRVGQRLKVLVAGGGIGGLLFALAMKKLGMEVTVFERDLSAIRGEGQYRGPIQIQSNALAALEALDEAMADEVLDAGTVTGDRINGLVDGLTGDWYVKFDTWRPAVERGLPVTRVISRMLLQQILVKHLGEEHIHNGCNVVDFTEDKDKVTVTLADGSKWEGDLLIGADGIRSKVRDLLLKDKNTLPTYSGYTCYTGIADFLPADIETVGYRVFLGNKQYFVSSDVGHGKMQWYGFYNEPAGGTDSPGARKQRLLEIFGHWCDNVVDLINATPEEMILRRDIFDRIPILSGWSSGRVTLMGDSAHAMQPNLGQGGCMAIEDAHQLALDIKEVLEAANGQRIDIPGVLRRYERERLVRTAAIHGLARMAAIAASTYKAYLGEGLGPLEWMTQLKIPHPGRVGGQLAMTPTMPALMGWVLGGNAAEMPGRAPHCILRDRARADYNTLYDDSDALERATIGEWILAPGQSTAANRLREDRELVVADINGHGSTLGSDLKGVDGLAVTLNAPTISGQHARFHVKDGACYVTDLGSHEGTYLNGQRLSARSPHRIHIGDIISFGTGPEVTYRVKQLKPIDMLPKEIFDIPVA